MAFRGVPPFRIWVVLFPQKRPSAKRANILQIFQILAEKFGLASGQGGILRRPSLSRYSDCMPVACLGVVRVVALLHAKKGEFAQKSRLLAGRLYTFSILIFRGESTNAGPPKNRTVPPTFAATCGELGVFLSFFQQNRSTGLGCILWLGLYSRQGRFTIGGQNSRGGGAPVSQN